MKIFTRQTMEIIMLILDKESTNCPKKTHLSLAGSFKVGFTIEEALLGTNIVIILKLQTFLLLFLIPNVSRH